MQVSLEWPISAVQNILHIAHFVMSAFESSSREQSSCWCSLLRCLRSSFLSKGVKMHIGQFRGRLICFTFHDLVFLGLVSWMWFWAWKDRWCGGKSPQLLNALCPFLDPHQLEQYSFVCSCGAKQDQRMEANSFLDTWRGLFLLICGCLPVCPGAILGCALPPGLWWYPRIHTGASYRGF